MKRNELTRPGIYKITSPSGRYYIGSSARIWHRWLSHRNQLERGDHHCHGLRFAAKKYGIEKLVLSVVEFCEIDKLIEREQFHMDAAPKRSLYNSSPTAGSNRGVPCSDLKKLAISLAHKGRKASPLARQRMREAHLGRKLPLATRLKMSQAQTGHKRMTPEVREKIGSKSGRSTSGYRGVHRDVDRDCWAAKAPGGKAIGRYATKAEAIAARELYMLAPEAHVPVSVKFTPSGHTGVSWHKGKQKWCAFVGSGKTLKTLGAFATAEEAAAGRARYLADPDNYAPPRKPPVSGHQGIFEDKAQKKWMAYSPEQKYLGRYKTIEEAVAARAAYLESVTLPQSTPSASR